MKIVYLENISKKIYPDQQELKQKYVSSTKALVVVIDLVIKDNNISTKLYNRVDVSPFEIVRAPFSNSNISSKIIYSSTGFEIIR